jgi:poly-gamma-glutamate synthesis protein (capsule biosynthesis protein)
MSIIIGADIVPTESNRAMFATGDAAQLFGTELSEILKIADYRIFNLEVPLVDQASPIAKYGPSLIAPTDCINGLKAMGIDLLTLANNHIMDQGVEGLKSSVRMLEQVGISHVGTADHLQKAAEPFYFTAKGKRYGVYACAEHEFSIVRENAPGVNPFDPLESPDHVAQMKAQCDYAIVLYHGGKEYYRYPSPNLQKTCRKLVEKGANLVICQHSHCIGCEEKYFGGTIVYGQGNFLFDHGDNEYRNTSLLVQITNDGQISYIPLKKQGNCVQLATETDAQSILQAFYQRSEDIQRLGFIQNKYAEFAREYIDGYILYFLGLDHNFFYKGLNKLSGQRLRKYIVKHAIKKRGLGMRNYIECEAHWELLVKGLENK